jgi:DNA (cytosine-5)-methyltransferase 1
VRGVLVTRPLLLDLFCGDGGAGEGYRRAGFDVVGVDLEPFAYPPGEFHQGDALAFLREHGRDFDAIHASPPCHDHTKLQNAHGRDYGTGHLLVETLDELRRVGRPYVVENVDAATVRAPMAAAGHAPAILCGSQFGLELRHHGLRLQLRRHRLFAATFPFLLPACSHRGEALDVTGHSPQGRIYRRRREQGVPVEGLAERRAVMGTPWITDRDALTEAIPPAFTEYLGGWLLDHLAAEDPAAA